MKKTEKVIKIFYITIFALSLVLPLVLPAKTAKIKIDIDSTIGEIDPKIYGVFMEPIGWGWALLVWCYAIAWFLFNDRVKLLTYRVLGVK